jgi:hypothetical protein
LNFFGEKISVEKPKSISALRSEISKLFFFSPQDAAEILLTYNENGDKIIIENDEDLKAFLNSKIAIIDLDISQSSKIYKDNLNQLQEESLKDKKSLDELIKHGEELNKLKETKFAAERKELKEIQLKIMELFQKKCHIRRKIFEGVKQINKEISENDKKIEELQKKMGIKVAPKNKKNECKKELYKKMKMPFHHKMFRVAHPHHPRLIFQNVYPQKLRNKRPCGVKFGNTEYIDIPKETETSETIETTENNEIDMKMKTIDDWGKCLLTKTQEITNKLAEKFKDFPGFNLSISTEEVKKEEKKEDKKEEKKEDKKEEKKEIHYFVACDGCNMKPLIGKRYKCKGCPNFDYCEQCYEKNKEKHGHEFLLIEKSKFGNPFPHHHRHHGPRHHPFFGHHMFPGFKFDGTKPENVPKKMEHCPTMGNIFEKEKIANKIVHFGVKCDGCGSFPIIGCRFKCAVCPNFDYCEQCEKKLSEKHNHPFLKIYEPKMRPAFIKFSK